MADQLESALSLNSIDLEPRYFLYILIAIVIIDHLWFMLLTKRQIIVCQNALFVPEEIRQIIPMEIYHRARIYEMHKAELDLWKHFIEILFGVVELYFGFYPFVWDVATKILQNASGEEIWISVIFMMLISIYVSVRILPVLIYDKCILELRYGVAHRRMSCGWFLCCTFGAIVLSQLIVAPLTMLLVVFVQHTGYFFNYYLWLISVVLTLIMMFLLPLCIMPTIGKQAPVPEGALYNELKKVADASGFPMKRIYIVRTNALFNYSNAYFYGSCCLKRIVIFDTMLLNKGKTSKEDIPAAQMGRGLSNQLIAGVVAHELGHWKYNHFCKAMVLVKFHLLLTLALFGLLFHWYVMYEAVGFEEGLMPIVVGFIIAFRFAMLPYLTLSNFVLLCIMRRFEYQADKYAHQLGYSLQLQGALLKIYADNMGFPVYDKWYSMWNHTHPTLLQRMAYQQKLTMLAIQRLLNQA